MSMTSNGNHDCVDNIQAMELDSKETDESFQNKLVASSELSNASVVERFGKLVIFQRPLNLVFTDDKMNLQIDESVLNQISSIDVPLSVVGVCGVYRTGKSYLMNRLAGKKTGFSLGSTVDSETQGIWAWCRPHPKVEDQVLLLLDTEGLSDAKKNDHDHDAKVFCLTMLMSSCLIYNMKGVIDKDALDRLSIIADITKTVVFSRKNNEEVNEDVIKIISPHFVLCLRDFYYDIPEQTADEYMESCLEDSSKHIDIKKNIKTFFPRRKCFAISQPALNQDLKKLETLPEDNLAPDFKKNVEQMMKYIYTLGPKCSDELMTKRWDGNTFDCFLRSYMSDLSKCQQMDIASAMQKAIINHNSKLRDEICRQYQAELDGLKIPEPSESKLLGHAINKMQLFLKDFRQEAHPSVVEDFEEQVGKSMESNIAVLLTRNKERVKQLCFDYLRSSHQTTIKNNEGKYDSKDGLNKYEDDLDDILQTYEKEFGTYDNAVRCEALQRFRESIALHKMKVKSRAEQLKEKEKNEEIEREKLKMQLHIDSHREKAEKANSKSEKQIVQLQIDLYKAKVDDEKMREEKENIQKELEHANKEKIEAMNDLSKIREERDQIIREKENVQKDLQHANQENIKAINDLSKIREERDVFLRQNENVKKDLEHANNENRKVMIELSKITEERDELIVEKETAQKVLYSNMAQASIDKIKMEIQVLKINEEIKKKNKIAEKQLEENLALKNKLDDKMCLIC